MKPLERLTQMKRFALLLVAVALVASVIRGWAQPSPRSDAEGASQSAKAVRGATPYAELERLTRIGLFEPLPVSQKGVLK